MAELPASMTRGALGPRPSPRCWPALRAQLLRNLRIGDAGSRPGRRDRRGHGCLMAAGQAKMTSAPVKFCMECGQKLHGGSTVPHVPAA